MRPLLSALLATLLLLTASGRYGPPSRTGLSGAVEPAPATEPSPAAKDEEPQSSEATP